MNRLLPIAGVAILLGGCAKSWWIRTEHTAQLDVDQPKATDFGCAVGVVHPYGHTVTVTSPFDEAIETENWSPLRLRLTSHAGGIVTVDWDHSAIVDAGGSSYHVLLFESGASSTNFEAIKKPPAPVLAPDSHIDVLILPEPRYGGQENMFFLPPVAEDKASIRIVLALSGGNAPHLDCVLHAHLSRTQLIRSTESSWPTDRERCVPHLGCAEGVQCIADRCVSPGKKGQRAGARFGEACFVSDDCESGLTCQSARCFGTSTRPK